MKPSRPVTFRGETRSVAEWAKHFGLREDTIYYRMRIGLPLEQVFAPARTYSCNWCGRRGHQEQTCPDRSLPR